MSGKSPRRCRALAPIALLLTVAALSAPSAGAQCPYEDKQRLIPGGAPPEARLGPVSLDRDRVAIGARGAGRVYVYRFDGERWQEEAELRAPDPRNDVGFGTSVALSGDRLAVGNPNISSDGGTYVGPGVGGVETFQWDGQGWMHEETLFSSARTSEGYFGSVVAMDGSRLVVGMAMVGGEPGRVYVFEHLAGRWSETAFIQEPFGESGLFRSFGRAVDVDGDRILVGALGHDVGGTTAGSAYLYQLRRNSWELEKRLFATDFHDRQNFGFSVALDGERLLVGAPGDNAGGPSSGAAYFFEYDAAGPDWRQAAKLRQGDRDDRYGTSVDLDGDSAGVGVPGGAWQGRDGGTALLYHREAAGWKGGLRLVPGDGGSEDGGFGGHVQVQGDVSLVGAPDQDVEGVKTGAVYAYRVTELALDVRPDELSPGEAAAFAVCKGRPRGLLLPVLEEWNGQRLSLPLTPAVQRFDDRGIWRQDFVVPPGLEGNTAVFVAYGFSSVSPKVVASWREVVEFVD